MLSLTGDLPKLAMLVCFVGALSDARNFNADVWTNVDNAVTVNDIVIPSGVAYSRPRVTPSGSIVTSSRPIVTPSRSIVTPSGPSATPSGLSETPYEPSVASSLYNATPSELSATTSGSSATPTRLSAANPCSHKASDYKYAVIAICPGVVVVASVIACGMVVHMCLVMARRRQRRSDAEQQTLVESEEAVIEPGLRDGHEQVNVGQITSTRSAYIDFGSREV